MPPTYPATTVKIPLAEDLSPADILSDLDNILSLGYGELRVSVQDHRIVTSSTTTHRRRRHTKAPHK